ncbi:MAG: EcsC family protein [Actinobacteria bacterium]|nr:EcsC family protein [Actinomycetota bacterium]
MEQDEIIDVLPLEDDLDVSAEDLAALWDAKRRLEHPSLTARISDLVGRPVEGGLRRLPQRWNRAIETATETALLRGLEVSLKTMGHPQPKRSRDRLHKAVAVSTGAVGGAMGAAALPVELTVSTCLMLRSIADIARSEGHDISDLEVRLACLEVFALGSSSSSDDAGESGYWMVRGALSKYLSEAANHLARKGLGDRSAPALLRLITQISARFGVVVSEQAVARLVPVVGAVSGGTINYLFMDHFQDIARGHFVVKRLERKYGTAAVREAYHRLPA